MHTAPNRRCGRKAVIARTEKAIRPQLPVALIHTLEKIVSMSRPAIKVWQLDEEEQRIVIRLGVYSALRGFGW